VAAAGAAVDVVENDEMRYLASRRLDMGAARAAALPRSIREKVRRATFVFDASGRFEALGAAPFPNLERAELAATHARERPAPFHCRREPMGDAFYADVLPLLRGVAAIRDMKCYVRARREARCRPQQLWRPCCRRFCTRGPPALRRPTGCPRHRFAGGRRAAVWRRPVQSSSCALLVAAQ
jgi:hypothetical protein